MHAVGEDADGNLLRLRPRTGRGGRVFHVGCNALHVGIGAERAADGDVQPLLHRAGYGERQGEGVP